MAIDSLTLVRKRIGDNKKTETESFELAPTSTTVQLAYSNATVLSVYDKDRATAQLQEPDDYTFDGETGVLTLGYTASDGATLTVVYNYYAISDAELNQLIEDVGINNACIEAIRWIIADASKLHDYSRGATSESLSQIVKNLQAMLKDYNASLGGNADGTPNADLTILKRTNQWYRGTVDIKGDLSRDDSLSL